MLYLSIFFSPGRSRACPHGGAAGHGIPGGGFQHECIININKNDIIIIFLVGEMGPIGVQIIIVDYFIFYINLIIVYYYM